MKMYPNKKLPPYPHPQWAGVPMNTCRLATILANKLRLR